MGRAGGCDWSKCLYFAKVKLKIHVMQLRSILCPKICLWAASKIFGTTMVQVCQNPMAHYYSYTLGSFVLYEWESQIILKPPSLNAWKCGKFKNVIRATCGRPTLLTIAKGHRDELHMNDVMYLIYHPPSIWVEASYYMSLKLELGMVKCFFPYTHASKTKNLTAKWMLY